MDDILLTKSGLEDLKAELLSMQSLALKEQKYQKERGGAMDSFHETAAFGASQAAIMSKYLELQSAVNNAKLLPENINSQTVALGSRVTFEHLDGEIKTYQIVHPLEANLVKNKVSLQSPLGHTLLGKKVGDLFVVNSQQYKITAIS